MNNLDFKNKIIIGITLVIFTIIIAVAAMFMVFSEEKEVNSDDPAIDQIAACESFGLDECPAECVVCPPCMACSSLGCQTESFCTSLGIDRSWYEKIKAQITNFDECVSAGNTVMESYPRQCRSGEQTFTENIGNELEKTDLIRIDSPRPNQVITSPLQISGQAVGPWFFEGDFPIVLVDEDGVIITKGYATAESDSMVEEFVEFTAELEFIKPEISKQGTLILRKDNASGLSEHDDALEVPVKF